MSDIKQQIFKELDVLENAIAKLSTATVNAEKQTNLEVAILTEQVKNLREKNERAIGMIDESIGIIKGLK